MPFTGPIEDRLAIRDLYDSYADGANRGDRADWLAGWSDDAVWWSHYFDLKGRDAIAAKYDEITADVRQTIFMTQICSIEVSGDSAKCRAVTSERLLQKAGGEYQLTGLYEDELERRGGQWLFVRRVYNVLHEAMVGAE
ncbi:MAG: nuclear transport factor 2 family protein [Novosphingobium sp.]